MQLCVLVLSLVAAATPHHHHHHHEQHESPDPSVSPSGNPVTRSVSGSFEGSWMETRRQRRIQAYRGIRYAEPPVGELRFQPPKPILHYPSLVNATADGPACPLPAGPDYYVDEDCLTINVYTPRNNGSKPLPVIFYIHAGGFYSMTGRSDLAGPHYLLERDLVLVTINYRLATLGFLSTGDELAPGNNGLKDQVVALRWVQRNIAAFGGDPGLVTITGCSAGSISVMLHMISPMSKGLFHRGIGMSASPTGLVRTPTDQYRQAVRQAELVNCPTHSSRAIIDCLKTKPWRELAYSLSGFYEFGFDPVGIWLPNVELDFGQERFLPVQPIEAIQQGCMHAVPFIIGQTKGEFFWKAYTILNNATLMNEMNAEWEKIAPISFQLPRNNSQRQTQGIRHHLFHDQPIRNDTESAVALGDAYGDSIIGFLVHRMAQLMSRHSPEPVYYYQFEYFGNHSHYEDPVTGKPVEAAHHDELIYLFTLSYRFPTIPLHTTDSRIVDRITAIWYNFATYGDPNPGPHSDTPELATLSWPTLKPELNEYLHFGEEFSVGTDMKAERFRVWEQLYPLERALLSDPH